MSYISFDGGKIFFHNNADEKFLLIDTVTSSENRSRVHSHIFTEKHTDFPLTNYIRSGIEKIFNNSTESLAGVTVFLRITAELIRKPQVHKVLRIGEWGALNEVLEKFLTKFNDENFLYCYAKSRPLENVPNAKFIFSESEDYFLPENKFSSIILDKPFLREEIFFASRDFGKIFFVAKKDGLPYWLQKNLLMFELSDQIFLFELTVTPDIKIFLRSQSLDGQIDKIKSTIRQTIELVPQMIDRAESFSGNEKKFFLDSFFPQLTNSEKLLAEIFPQLNNDKIKLEFNLLKEFFIDYRLDFCDAEKVLAQQKILSNKFY